jgi:hypothetical protein
MSQKVKDLFNAVASSQPVADARDYVSSNAKGMTERASSAAKPYQKMAQDNMKTARKFVNSKVEQVKSADSFSSIIDIFVGIIMSAIRLLIAALRIVREYVLQKYQSKYIDAKNKVEEIVDNVKTKAIDLPNAPAVKKVEAVSKKVLGERHDQAVEFIKSSVLPIVHKSYERVMPTAMKSPLSTSSNADLTTEGGSVSAASPREEHQKTRGKQSSANRRK